MKTQGWLQNAGIDKSDLGNKSSEQKVTSQDLFVVWRSEARYLYNDARREGVGKRRRG